MRNFLQRSATGILFVITLIVAIFIPIARLVIFPIVIIIGLKEFYTMITSGNEKINIQKLPAYLTGAYLFIATWLYSNIITDTRLFLPVLLYPIYVSITELYRKEATPVLNVATAIAGLTYVAIPFSLFNLLYLHNFPTLEEKAMEYSIGDEMLSLFYHSIFPLCFFLFIWINDTGAYIVGMTIGKRRLFERISPKKSWEGFWGGALFAIALSITFSYFFPVLTTIQWIGLALTVVTIGTYGDLWESLIKRTYGIKDSGNILPGHGGILDRFDSAILAIPAVVIYLYAIFN